MTAELGDTPLDTRLKRPWGRAGDDDRRRSHDARHKTLTAQATPVDNHPAGIPGAERHRRDSGRLQVGPPLSKRIDGSNQIAGWKS